MTPTTMRALLDRYDAVTTAHRRSARETARLDAERLVLRDQLLAAGGGSQYEVSVHLNDTMAAEKAAGTHDALTDTRRAAPPG